MLKVRMDFFVQPALETASTAVFTLATGMAVKYPVLLSGPNPQINGQAAMRVNNHIVAGDVPVILTDLATTVGNFWYNQASSHIVERLDLRNKHFVSGTSISGVEVTVTEHACIPENMWMSAPEFSQYLPGNSCNGTKVIPARVIDAWLKIGPNGVEGIAVPQSNSFSLIAIMNMISVAFYLIVTVSSFSVSRTFYNTSIIESSLTNVLALASGTMLVYAASMDVILDTQCTKTEAAIVAIPMTLFLMLAANYLQLRSNNVFEVNNAKFLIISSVSLSLSITALDYTNTEEFYSLVAVVINGVAALVVLLVISKANTTKEWTVTRFERAIIEIAIISSLRVLVHNELGELFALATAIVVAVITSKYCIPKKNRTL